MPAPSLAQVGRSLLRAAMQQRPGGIRMSARAYHRILKLARTIADLAEAIQYRPRRQT